MKYHLLPLSLFLLASAPAAQQIIGVGAAANDGTGDNPRAAFIKVNANFTELYSTAYQPLDADLTSWALVNRAAGVDAALAIVPNANGGLLTNNGTSTLTNKTISGGSNSLTNLPANQIAGVIPIGNIATGTPDGTKFVRDDGTLAVPSGGSFDATAVDAITWSDGANASNIWTFNLSGTDPTLTFGSGIITVGGDFAITGSFTAASMTVNGALSAGSQLYTEGAAPGTPAASSVAVYAKTDGLIYAKDDAGTETALSNPATTTDAFIIAISDETTAHTTGTAKVTFRAPYAFTITGVKGSLTTVSSSGVPTWDINESGVTILSTKLTIDASEKTSTTAATAAVVSDASIAADAEITIDIDIAGTGAAGGKLTIIHTH